MNGGGDEEVSAPAGPPMALEWKFSQVFGERTAGEEVQEDKINTGAVRFEVAGRIVEIYVCRVRKVKFLFVKEKTRDLFISFRDETLFFNCLAINSARILGFLNLLVTLFFVQTYAIFYQGPPVLGLFFPVSCFSVHDLVNYFDIISAIEFDKTGDHLATGDRGGRVVLFERTDTRDHGGSRRDLERMDYPVSRHPEFRYKTEFQSHEPEFDYLKSLEIEEKINKIRWCQTANSALFILSTNDKTIKYWKVQEKKVKKICDMNLDPSKAVGNGSVASSSISTIPKPYIANGGCPDRSYNYLSNDFSFPPGGISSLHLPVVASHETSLVPRCRRIYAHAHDYHINSISNNSDGETFISADDLRINLWNLEISNQSFNIVDVKPTNMEDLTEVITSAEFHPTHCNMLAYSSSKGSIRLIDLRQSALCDTHTKL
ncbi:hypothetical protein HHK36_032187 [Tetracentron sinense]|uniref:Serine/threonine-protein phosphatase 2A 55 kDa regulatory subunit B n=1 Tax=Tetracentron sinense TaxID=13715 RepID=A0A835CXE3_TETSI|nr:hypothetical protein HHK36_032187 [Tetracentron sinense]